MRLARGVDPKSTKGLRGSAEKATQQQSGLKINAREIFRVVWFSTFATRGNSGSNHAMSDRSPECAHESGRRATTLNLGVHAQSPVWAAIWVYNRYGQGRNSGKKSCAQLKSDPIICWRRKSLDF
jgi:hypothetical protein